MALKLVQALDLQAFCDSSGKGTAVAVYAVMYQESGIHQSLLAANARLAKKGLTMPRLELISAYMGANIVDNITSAFEGYVVRSVFCVWMDRTYSSLVLDR